MGTTYDGMNDAHRFSAAAPEERYVYGSCSPGWHSAGSHEEALTQWISFMEDVEVERVCCLLPGQKSDLEAANLGRYREAFGTDSVLHAPMPSNRLPDETVLREEILPFLAECVRTEERVVVHGLSGVGRTGQVLTAWLVWYREYDPETAVETVQKQGRDPMELVDIGAITEEDVTAFFDAVAEW